MALDHGMTHETEQRGETPEKLSPEEAIARISQAIREVERAGVEGESDGADAAIGALIAIYGVGFFRWLMRRE